VTPNEIRVTPWLFVIDSASNASLGSKPSWVRVAASEQLHWPAA
jgi:hypothetical protein